MSTWTATRLRITRHAAERFVQRGGCWFFMALEVDLAKPFGNFNNPYQRFLKLPNGLIAVVRPGRRRDAVVTFLERWQAVKRFVKWYKAKRTRMRMVRR